MSKHTTTHGQQNTVIIESQILITSDIKQIKWESKANVWYLPFSWSFFKFSNTFVKCCRNFFLLIIKNNFHHVISGKVENSDLLLCYKASTSVIQQIFKSNYADYTKKSEPNDAIVNIHLSISFLKNIRATKTNGPSPQWDNKQDKL